MRNLLAAFKNLFSNKKGVVFILLRPDDTSLLQFRDGNSKRFPYRWCWPGGACDPGEGFDEAAIREIYEEYEIRVDKGNITWLMSRYMGHQKVFVCRVPQIVNAVMHEGADMRWMSIDEIKSISLGYDQDNILRKFERYLQRK